MNLIILVLCLIIIANFLNTKACIRTGWKCSLFSIWASLKNHSFNVEIQCAVFDTNVTSVHMYASGGWQKSGDVEKVHANFCRKVLGVEPKTAINFM